MTKPKKQLVEQLVVIAEEYNSFSRKELVELINSEFDKLPTDATNPRFEIVKHEHWYPYQDDPHPSYSASLQLSFYRLETNEEYQLRMEAENKQKQAQQDRDRAELKRLSKLFNVRLDSLK